MKIRNHAWRVTPVSKIDSKTIKRDDFKSIVDTMVMDKEYQENNKKGLVNDHSKNTEKKK